MRAVAAEGVWKFFGDYPALRDVILHAEPGACLALIGRNGAGKTTLLRIIGGLLEGRPRHRSASSATIRAKPQRAAASDSSAMASPSTTSCPLSKTSRSSAGSTICPIPRKSAMEWLERTGLERVKDGLVREFSRGMRQRLAMARAFLHQPSVLLLDEPFTALDDRAIAVLQRLLKQALAEGRTVIMSTHQLREALELATHVALLNRGTIAFHGERTPEMVADPGWVYAHYGEG